MVEDKFHMITSQNCGDNHYVVEIPDDISLFEFFEMNLDLEVTEREVYSLLDWIRSLGGF